MKTNESKDLNKVIIKLKDISRILDKYKDKKYVDYLLNSHLNNIKSIINSKEIK